jgi:hypothetical protein
MVLLGKTVSSSSEEYASYIISSLVANIQQQQATIATDPSGTAKQALAVLLKCAFIVVEEAGYCLQTIVIPVLMPVCLKSVRCCDLHNTADRLLLRYIFRILRVCSCSIAKSRLTGGYFEDLNAAGQSSETQLEAFISSSTASTAAWLHTNCCTSLATILACVPVIIECLQSLAALLGSYEEYISADCLSLCIQLCYMSLTTLRESYLADSVTGSSR